MKALQTEEPNDRQFSMSGQGAAYFIGVSRHRIGIDGVGVTTLAAFHGCPLRCRYCLNASCWGPTDRLATYTPESLLEKVRIDNLYFLATGGGICFGGGEPLMHPDFLVRFREICPSGWRLTLESSLNVPRAAVEAAAEVVDDFIIDIKDFNPGIYKRYTGRSNRRVLSNLKWLLKKKGAERLLIRVPLIPDFNTDNDRDSTVAALESWGVTRIERFKYRV